MLSLTLDCGRHVWVDGFDLGLTYACLMLGKPNARLNAEIIERARTDCEQAWYTPVHLIPPKVFDHPAGFPLLPSMRLRVRLFCNEPLDPANGGSSLAVVWFADECWSQPIEAVIRPAVLGLPWEELATDFDW